MAGSVKSSVAVGFPLLVTHWLEFDAMWLALGDPASAISLMPELSIILLTAHGAA